MTVNTPNLDPANNYSLVGTLQTVLNNFQQNLNTQLPAKIISYDREKNRAEVQLMINLTTTGGQQISRAPLSNIPVLILGAGNFSLSFPLNPGDLGWIMASDRDISLFLQNYNQTAPNTTRMNNFSDSVFIPDVMKSYNITDSNDGYLIIQSNDGTMNVSMGINTTTGAHEVNVNADRINLTLNDPTPIIGGSVAIYGNLIVSGNVTPNTPIPPYPP